MVRTIILSIFYYIQSISQRLNTRLNLEQFADYQQSFVHFPDCIRVLLAIAFILKLFEGSADHQIQSLTFPECLCFLIFFPKCSVKLLKSSS